MPPRIREIVAALAVAIALIALPTEGEAQDDAFRRGLAHESDERYREAAEAYRESLRANAANLPALLGLERVYAMLGMTDSLLPVLERAITAAPRVNTLRVAQIRSLRTVGQHDRAREAFERWVREMPRDPAPYREYARLLLQDNQTATADSILQRARSALGRNDELDTELAQLRSAMGLWVLSAQSWRRAVAVVPHYEQAAVFSLAPTPPERRDSVRAVLTAQPARVEPLRLMAALEILWGAPERGWQLLAPLRPDSAVVAAWTFFADRAEEAQAWLPMRDALVGVARAAPTRQVLLRAASAALAGGEPASAADLGRRALSAPGEASVGEVLPTLVRALGALGRAADAQRLVEQHERDLDPAQREEIMRQLAWAWVRAGDVARARELIGSAAVPGEVEGWLGLYEGDLDLARRRLTRSAEPSPQLVMALAVLTRTGADQSPAAGRAFLALARGDTAAAADGFERAAQELPDATPLLLLHAARLHSAREPQRAAAIWGRIAEEHAAAPEAPEALLEWSRALRRTGDRSGAVERLEHLILTYPRSALLPQARRELEQARGSVPPAG